MFYSISIVFTLFIHISLIKKILNSFNYKYKFINIKINFLNKIIKTLYIILLIKFSFQICLLLIFVT